MRTPLRVVRDDDVDRMQVYRWRHHSRALLIARRLSGGFPERGAGQKDGIYVQRVALEGLLFVGHVSIRGMGRGRRGPATPDSSFLVLHSSLKKVFR